jgi:hypothetical protein
MDDDSSSAAFGVDEPDDAPTEMERALKAAALGAVLGVALALLARARERGKG